MKKLLTIFLLFGICACAPKPPCCNNKAEGMRPINPEYVTTEQMAAWEKQKQDEHLAALNDQETFHEN